MSEAYRRLTPSLPEIDDLREELARLRNENRKLVALLGNSESRPGSNRKALRENGASRPEHSGLANGSPEETDYHENGRLFKASPGHG